jgi:hypothetical protein
VVVGRHRFENDGPKEMPIAVTEENFNRELTLPEFKELLKRGTPLD